MRRSARGYSTGRTLDRLHVIREIASRIRRDADLYNFQHDDTVLGELEKLKGGEGHPASRVVGAWGTPPAQWQGSYSAPSRVSAKSITRSRSDCVD
jgi:hypothetical protein